MSGPHALAEPDGAPTTTEMAGAVEEPSLGWRREQRIARRAVAQRWTQLRTRAQRVAEENGTAVPDVMPRLAKCGVFPLGSGVARPDGPVGPTRVGLSIGSSGTALVQGLQHCASPHVCACCAATLRSARAAELERGVEHFWRERPDGETLLATLTLRHGRSDALADTLGACLAAWSAVVRGPAWSRARRRHGIVAYVRAYEVTLGSNGWHPHIHCLLFLGGQLDDEELAALRASLYRRWAGSLARAGLERPSPERGVRVDRVVPGESGAGAYLAKTSGVGGPEDRSGRRAAVEILRSDLKTSWSGLTPFELLDLDGTDRGAWAVARWREYEDATWGRRTLVWSRDARKLLGLDKPERTDDEIVAEPDPAPVVCALLSFPQWKTLRGHRAGASVTRLLAMIQGGAHRQALWWLEAIVGTVELGPGWPPQLREPGAGP